MIFFYECYDFLKVNMDQENDENLVKITDICRACLTRAENMICLLENTDDILILLSKFASVANLEIEIGFKYPSYLCTLCEEKILNSYEFQQQCQKSNELVNEYLTVFEKEDTISTEPESEITSINLNTLEEVTIIQELQNTTQTVQPQYEEISNPSCEDNEQDKTEYDEKFQKDLSKVILDLKEKYRSDNVCVFCECHAANSKTLSAHVYRMHKESRNTWCSICNKIFSNLAVHSDDEHKNDFLCILCDMQCSSFKSIIEHLYRHQVSGKKSHDITETVLQKNESICTETYGDKKMLKNHSETKLIGGKLCNKTLSINKILEKHKCNRGKRKNNEEFGEEIKPDDNMVQIKEEEFTKLLGKEEATDTYKPPEEFKNFTPKEVPLRNKTCQKMRLKQYCVEDVNKAISIVKEKFYKHVNCIFCNFTAVTNRSLSVHVTRVHKEHKGKWCSSCNQVIENQTSHNKQVHYEDLKCPFCRKIKANMGHFMEHLSSHSAERFHKCNICHKSFISPRHLRIHRETHVKAIPFSCDICNKTFLQAKYLKAHLKTHQRSEKNNENAKCDSIDENILKREGDEYDKSDNVTCKSECEEKIEDVPEKPHNYCKDCNKKVRSLLSHYIKHHSKTKSENSDRQNLCPHCGKRFKTRSKLTVHIRTHTGEAPYKCQYCDKRVKTRNILVVHERTHTGEKPYMCTVCGKSFAQSSVLNTHARIHTGRPEQCTICEKRFCRPAELRLHMRKHTGEKPYMCDQCGQGFKQRSHLVEHTKTHNDDRPYKCEYCEKAFKSSGTLKCHLQIHSGQKPFKCSQCSYACRQPYSLTQHMIQHDNDKPQADYPHKCQICQRNFATIAHLTAHHNRFHPDLKMKSLEPLEQPPIHNQMIMSDTVIDHETDANNYHISQETPVAEPSQIQMFESIENVDTMIIQPQVQDGAEMKFEQIHIEFATLQEL